MANVISKSTLFPVELTGELLNLVKGSSALAELSGRSPLTFNGNNTFTFSMDKEVDLLEENGKKSNGGGTIGTVAMKPVKIEYGMRASEEFMIASAEYQINILRTFADGFSRKAARGLDIMAFHGFNPRTGAPAPTTIGSNHFDAAVTQTVTRTADANADVESAVALLTASGHRANGIAAGLSFNAALAAETKSNGDPMFPELGWGATPDTLRGIRYRANGTVDYTGTTTKAVIGDFERFRWGIAREIPVHVIEYGNPDNDAQAGDLKGSNQVYIRAEMFIGWAILDPTAFALIET